MGPTTDAGTTEREQIAGFYDALSADYDVMTGFEARLERERPAFKRLVEDYGIRTAVDAGSGTGVHALLLAELGVDVTAVDLSEKMTKRLMERAVERGLMVSVAVGDIRHLPNLAPRGADAVLCLGNTLAHLESPAALEEAARSFVRTLKPGGLLTLQLLNYDRIIEQRETIQSIRQIDGVTFVRFYEFGGERLRFNILRIWSVQGTLHHDLHKSLVSPFGHDVVRTSLEHAGFIDIRVYGSIGLEAFQVHDSTDVVVVARSAS